MSSIPQIQNEKTQKRFVSSSVVVEKKDPETKPVFEEQSVERAASVRQDPREVIKPQNSSAGGDIPDDPDFIPVFLGETSFKRRSVYEPPKPKMEPPLVIKRAKTIDEIEAEHEASLKAEEAAEAERQKAAEPRI